jgi:signal transduction histidine kinase
MQSLRPSVLDDMGLVGALGSEFMYEQMKLADIQYVPSISVAEAELSDEASIAIYRIAQECITNVIRHSKANNCWLTLVTREGKVVLEIRDDGIGFDVSSMTKKENSFGLQGIDDRVTALGGKHIVHSDANGTKHIIELSLSV